MKARFEIELSDKMRSDITRKRFEVFEELEFDFLILNVLMIFCDSLESIGQGQGVFRGSLKQNEIFLSQIKEA